MSENLRETNADREVRLPGLAPATPTLVLVDAVALDDQGRVTQYRNMRPATLADLRAALENLERRR